MASCNSDGDGLEVVAKDTMTAAVGTFVTSVANCVDKSEVMTHAEGRVGKIPVLLASPILIVLPAEDSTSGTIDTNVSE